MAVEIGPKIGIQGEAEYRKQINNIITQSKTLSSEMKTLESSFTKEGNAVEQNEKKKALLNKQIDVQTQKVNELTKMMEESEKQTDANGNRTQELENKTLKWQQAVNNATTELNNMKNELNNMPSSMQVVGQNITEVGDKITSAGEKVSGFGDSLTKCVTGPIAALATASVAAFKQVDSGADEIVKKTGATGDALDAMQNSMNNIATTIPTTFENAGSAIGEVNTRFNVTGQQLEDLSTQFIKFADINDVDVTDAVDSTQKAMAAFNLTADQAPAYLDTLTSVAQATGISVNDLSSAMTTNGTALKSMGLNASDSAKLIGTLEKSGVDASTVMTGLSKVQKSAMEDGVSMSDELSKAVSSSGDAIDIFGSKAGPKLYESFQSGILSLDMFTTSTTSLDDALGTVSSTFETTQDPIDQWQTTLNSLEIVGAELGNSLSTVIVPILQQVAEWAQKVADWWSSLDEGTQNLIVKCALVAAAAGPVLSIGGKLISGIGSVVSTGGNLISWMGSLGDKAGGVASSIGGVASNVSGLGTSAGTAASGVSSCSTSFGQLAGQALSLVALGAGIALAGVGIKQIADAAVEVANAGPGAAVAMGLMVVAVAGLAVGAEALGPALTAGAVGFVAFGAGVTLVGTGIAIASAGITLLATQMPTIAQYGGSAATAITQLGAGLVVMGAGSAVASAGVLALGVSLTTSSIGIALGAASISALASATQPLANSMKTASTSTKSLIPSITSASTASTALTAKTNLLANAMGTMSSNINTVSSQFNNSINGMYSTASNQIGRLQSLFANTKFSFNQHIAMPHFSMSGSFNARTGSVPSTNVSWYKSAYSNPVMFNSPTVLQTSSGLKGFGDGSGGEIVIGKNTMMTMISTAVQQALGYVPTTNGGTSNQYSYGGINVNVYASKDTNIDGLANDIEERINSNIKARRAVFE